jgi:hypothetical protein
MHCMIQLHVDHPLEFLEKKNTSRLGHIMGLQTHVGIWVWVVQLQVQVDLESPARNPHLWPGYGGFF